MKNSEGVATTIGVSALLISHGSANDWGGLGVAPNGAKLLKGGLQLSQSPSLLTYNTLFKLTGLNTAHRYALALASQYDTDDRSSSYRVGLVQATVDNGGNATDWNAGFNYALLDNLIPNSAGEIHVQAMVNTDWAPLNGWQLLDRGVRSTGASAYTTLDTCGFGALGTALITGSNISITVPYGTAISALTPTLVAAAGATISPSGPQNFTSPVTYRVTAENAVNYQDYTVTIAVAPNVSFTTTTLPVTSTSLGAQILSTGTLVAANHFGNGSDGLAADAPVTLDNGLTFGTSIDFLGSGWNGHATDSWASSISISNAPYKTLMSCVFWIAWDPSVTPITFPGLSPGHTYRLQMISVQPNNCLVSVGGGTATTWSGDNTLLTSTWVQPAARTDMDVVLSRGTGQGEIHFNGYALHDVTSGFQPAPTGLTATAGDRQISLSWDAAPGATSYTVKRSLTTGGPYSSLGNSTGTTYLDVSLTNGIRYYYVVSATTALGDT